MGSSVTPGWPPGFAMSQPWANPPATHTFVSDYDPINVAPEEEPVAVMAIGLLEAPGEYLPDGRRISSVTRTAGNLARPRIKTQLCLNDGTSVEVHGDTVEVLLEKPNEPFIGEFAIAADRTIWWTPPASVCDYDSDPIRIDLNMSHIDNQLYEWLQSDWQKLIEGATK